MLLTIDGATNEIKSKKCSKPDSGNTRKNLNCWLSQSVGHPCITCQLVAAKISDYNPKHRMLQQTKTLRWIVLTACTSKDVRADVHFSH